MGTWFGRFTAQLARFIGRPLMLLICLVLAAGSIVYLQFPAARRFHPMVDPHKVMARLRVRPKPRSTP